MVAKFLDHDDRCDSSKNCKKATALDWQNNNFAGAAFLYISWPLLHDCNIKLPNCKRPLYGERE